MKKKFLSGIAAAAFLSLAAVSCNNDDDKETVIGASELPAVTDVFVKAHFPNVTYVLIKKEHRPESDGTVYEVRLSNGFEIDFDVQGNMVDIEGYGQAVPMEFVSEPIQAYLMANYKNFFVTSIDNERGTTEIELSNRVELIFDLQGNFLGIDR
ncbi:PepSY-like domain-containing protein [Flavobacterium sp. ACN6]|uniref:PepSY-like domain-containing protein n=1 Tax=Flavobacterium sp. ACN6 TaxID=1920426 RepID=UPI000BB34E86|nr:PepSY-like domain-containing protein [Flavobacterium sp. ACN6]PBJ04610.1 hypothetical protein BSF42_44170 [Flavobacterium sp. ACN6]